MCGRFTLTKLDPATVAAALDAAWNADDAARYRPRFNVAPTDVHPIVVAGADGRRKLTWAQWGMVMPQRGAPGRPSIQINARAETIATRGIFKHALLRLRCAVPADGYYDWSGPKTARVPTWFHRVDGGVIAFAAIALPWTDPATGVAIPRFAIATTAPNRVVGAQHERMPAILGETELDAWLDGPPAGMPGEMWIEQLRARLHPAPDELLVGTAVSPRVNDVRNDDAACLAER